MLSELRHALRSLLRTPSFAVVAVLVVAVGLGAGAAIFSVVRAVLLRPLPFHEPQRLHRVLEAHTPERSAGGWIGLSVATYDAWRRETALFSHTGASVPASVTLSGHGEPRMLPAAQITADFFPMLGVAPALGRGFTAEEDAAAAPVAILGERLWRTQFGGAADVLGRSVTLDGQPRTVIGVMPPGQRFQGDQLRLAERVSAPAPRPRSSACGKQHRH